MIWKKNMDLKIQLMIGYYKKWNLKFAVVLWILDFFVYYFYYIWNIFKKSFLCISKIILMLFVFVHSYNSQLVNYLKWNKWLISNIYFTILWIVTVHKKFTKKFSKRYWQVLKKDIIYNKISKQTKRVLKEVIKC